MASLFVIHGKGESMDLTRYIPAPNYSVIEVKNYVTWIDGNYNERRHITDKKVKGSLTLLFDTKEHFKEFINFVNNNADEGDGSLVCSLYCNNTDEVKTVNAFVDFENANEMPFFNSSESVKGFNVNVTERGNL